MERVGVPTPPQTSELTSEPTPSPPQPALSPDPKAPPEILLSHVPAPISSQEIKTRISGPKGVKRWEPSGVVSEGKHLWVVSDREGWLARYQLPLSQGVNHPTSAYQLQPELKHRVKWEGLAWERDQDQEITALLLLEAISRSVWRCPKPDLGCPELTQEPLGHINSRIDQSIPSPFKYVMFEALAHRAEPIIGVRGYQDRSRGLIPWSVLASSRGQMLMDARASFALDQKHYGMSGATYDAKRRGYWITWSYEDEAGSTQDAVGGILSFAPLHAQPQSALGSTPALRLSMGTHHVSSPGHDAFEICARFNLKPEGVTLNAAGDLFIVFDEDLDRKQGDATPQGQTERLQRRFALNDNEDFIWRLPNDHIAQACVTPSTSHSPHP